MTRRTLYGTAECDEGPATVATLTAAGRRRRARTDLVSALVMGFAEADRRWHGGVVRRPRVRLVAV